MRWNQIDFEKRTVTVGKAKTDGGSGRVIPLNQPAFDALVKWAGRLVESRDDDYAFPACEAAGIEREHPDKERIDPRRPIKSWRSAWRAALKRAGLQIRFHDLRHTCITNLAESQASEQTIMSIAGHLSRKMVLFWKRRRKFPLMQVFFVPVEVLLDFTGRWRGADSQGCGELVGQ